MYYLYRIQLTTDISNIAYIGTTDPSLIGDIYPNAVKIEKVDSLVILE